MNTGFQTGKEHHYTTNMVPQQADEDKGPCEPQSDLGEPLLCSIEQEDGMWIGRGKGWGALSFSVALEHFCSCLYLPDTISSDTHACKSKPSVKASWLY